MNELSLFTGYGGFSLGLRLAGLQTRMVMYVEWERYPQEIIKARIKDGFLDDAPIWGDISTLDGWQLRGVVDLITGGFPCQPHSTAGQRRGADDDRNLWPETLRIIREVGPRYVLLENVPGLLSASSDGGTTAYGGTVVGELASIGYSVHWQTIGADDVGAPHRRKRWWCIGVADSDSHTVWDRQQLQSQRRPASSTQSKSGHTDEELDDPRHDGQPRPQDPRGTGSRVHPQAREEQPEQPTGSGGGATGGEDTAYSNGTGAGGQTRDNYTIGSFSREGSEPRLNKRGAELAYSDGERGSGGKVHRGYERETSRGGETSTSQPGSQDEPLADSKSEGLEGVRDNSHSQGWQEPNGSTGLSSGAIPTWPPSPGDTDGWAALLAERPDLAPALDKEIESQFRGVHDGRSHRVDELKALGNGIVPAVAAEFLRAIIEVEEKNDHDSN